MLLKNHWILFHYLEIKSILIILVPTPFSTPTCYIILIFHNSSFQSCQLNQSCSPESFMYFLPPPLASCYFPCNLSLLSLFPSISPTPPSLWVQLMGTVKERSLTCTQEVLLKRAVFYQGRNQLEEGHYHEDTPKSILEKGGSFQPVSKWGDQEPWDLIKRVTNSDGVNKPKESYCELSWRMWKGWGTCAPEACSGVAVYPLVLSPLVVLYALQSWGECLY